MILESENTCRLRRKNYFLYITVSRNIRLLFPKAPFAFVDGRAIRARYEARFVSIVTSYDWFRDATIQPVARTVIFLRIPFRHLFEEQLFVVLVLGPAHMENIGFDFTGNHSFHVILRLVVFRAAREQRLSKFAPDLYSQALPAHEFCH